MKVAALLTLLATAALAGCVHSGGNRPVDSLAAADANVKLGVAYMNQGKLADAKEKLERAEKQNPKSAEGQFALAELYGRLEQPREAERRYRNAINLAPDKLEIVNGYAVFLCSSGEVDRGITEFERLVNNPLYGRQAVAASNAGLCLRDNKRLGDSVRYFEMALAKQPDYVDAVVYLADTQIELGKPELARRAVDNYQSMRSSARVLLTGVRAAVKQADCLGATGYVLRMRRDFPNSRETLSDLPQVLGNCREKVAL
ncbi:MAG TPA: type IV pilus biogenesis/stability protein PilW [Steroidobacteraceae bacterium]|nr:type IV pilus biogenesis/stability protein PilW [Steroidobacteraceae bacterium]